MKPLGQLDKESILSEEIFTEVFEQEDEIYKARLLISLEDRAFELGVKTKFVELVKTYKRVEKEMNRKKQRETVSSLENWTNFIGPYDRMMCRDWIATEDGIYIRNSSTGLLDVLACYHPILPIERLKNLETGEEQIKLAYKRNGHWQEMIVPKTMIASASKITSLSGRGIAVTSENAKFLVRYLADVENSNEEFIGVQHSSSKLGWISDGFIPYDKDIVFDGDSRFRQAFESVEEFGSREKWFSHVAELRKSGRIEIKFMLAASFSSVLLHILGELPYIADLCGETEGGKTVTHMLAASVWANPNESGYIGDFKTTDVALEAKADFLNHLPLILDDTSKTSGRIRENFEGFVYDLCSGKGKSRSNKDLGLRCENRWRNVILTNGERPLSSYVTQGGAINRILEVECGEKVYLNPHCTAELLKNNYGFAGKEFVKIVKTMGKDNIRKIQNEIMQQLQNDEKMQKQSRSLSVLLTADRIATEYLFKDGQYISLEEAIEVLVDRNELSDNERCYQYILGEIDINLAKFLGTNPNAERWGAIENGYAIINNNVFNNLCKKENYSRSSFLSWANKKGLIQTQAGKMSKQKKINGENKRCIFLKMDGEINGDEIEADQDGFIDIDKIGGQEELPFL